MIEKATDYVSGGYYITRLIERPSYVSPWLPDKMFSGSGCISDHIPDINLFNKSGIFTPEMKREQRNFWEFSPDDVKRWNERFDELWHEEPGWPTAFSTLESAQEVAVEFLSHLRDTVIFGIGLHPSMLEVFRKEIEPGPVGVPMLLEQEVPLVDGGEVLGFEPLVFFDYTVDLACSWLCNHLEKDAREKLDIVPNKAGFIETFDEAVRCTRYIMRDDVGAEPGLWLPWLMVRYS